MIYIFFKQNRYAPQTVSESEAFALRKLKKGGKETSFTHGGKEYYFNDIAFIGEKCQNGRCHRPEYRAHPLNEVCDYSFTESCVTCSKLMWKRDCDYNQMKFGKVVCYDHSPLGQAIGPKPETPQEKFVNAYIHSATQKGMNEDKAMRKANEMLKKVMV